MLHYKGTDLIPLANQNLNSFIAPSIIRAPQKRE